MKLVVGLGNPGDTYEKNRHNVGFMFVDALLEYLRSQHVGEAKKETMFDSISVKMVVGEETILIVKPQTFMNRSGEAVQKLMQFYKISPQDVFVAHDDLDLPLGKIRIEFARGPKLHNGINSIEQSLGTKKFTRIRIGVDNRDPENRMPGEPYVLQNFTQEELTSLDPTLKDSVQKLTDVISKKMAPNR